MKNINIWYPWLINLKITSTVTQWLTNLFPHFWRMPKSTPGGFRWGTTHPTSLCLLFLLKMHARRFLPSCARSPTFLRNTSGSTRNSGNTSTILRNTSHLRNSVMLCTSNSTSMPTSGVTAMTCSSTLRQLWFAVEKRLWRSFFLRLNHRFQKSRPWRCTAAWMVEFLLLLGWLSFSYCLDGWVSLTAWMDGWFSFGNLINFVYFFN